MTFVFHFRYLRKKLTHGMPGRDEGGQRDAPDEEETLDISPPFVIFFVIMMVGMLVALYFFYDYLGKRLSGTIVGLLLFQTKSPYKRIF
jgi:hypothetical protein